MTRRAIVLLSGGLDSATVLAMAHAHGYECLALSFDYGQRHDAELAAAVRVAESLGASLAGVAEHAVVDMSFFAEMTAGGSALTDETIDVPEPGGEGIPVTYVPARNTVFLAMALGWAEVADAEAIFIGVNAVDYSGYPDCRPEYIAAFQGMAALATKAGVEGHPVRIETPLIDLTKAGIINAGIALGVDYALTVSCYQADEAGRACGRCDACALRARGFADAGVDDPTVYA